MTFESSEEVLREMRSELANLGLSITDHASDLSLYHSAKYPADGTKTGAVNLAICEVRALTDKNGVGTTVRILVMAAADGDVKKRLLKAWKDADSLSPLAPIKVDQSDIIPDEAKGVDDVDTDNWPFDHEGKRFPPNFFDIVIGRNCWYSTEASTNELQCGMVGPARVNGLVIIGATRRMLPVVAPSLLATVNADVLRIDAIENVIINTKREDPDGFLIKTRKLGGGKPVARGQKLIQQIFVGKLTLDAAFEEALANATPALRERVKALLSFADSMYAALKTTQLRESAMLARGVRVNKSGRFTVALGLRAAAHLLLLHTLKLADVARDLTPLASLTGTSVSFCLFTESARKGLCEISADVASERSASLHVLGGLDELSEKIDAARSGGKAVDTSVLQAVIEACSKGPGSRSVLTVGEDKLPPKTAGTYYIARDKKLNNRDKVGIGLSNLKNRAKESAGGKNAFAIAICPVQFRGIGGGADEADARNNYRPTIVWQGADEVPSTLLLLDGLSLKEMYGSPNTVLNWGDMSRFGGEENGKRAKVAVDFVEALKESNPEEAEKEKSRAITNRTERNEKFLATAAAKGKSKADMQRKHQFSKLTKKEQSFLRHENNSAGGKKDS